MDISESQVFEKKDNDIPMTMTQTAFQKKTISPPVNN